MTEAEVVAPPTMAVFKYKLDVPMPASADLLEIELPKGATILRVGSQPGPSFCDGQPIASSPEFFLWALVCKGIEEVEKRKWLAVCTGQEFSAEALKDLAWISAQRHRGAIAGTTKPFEHQETVLAGNGATVIHFWISYPVAK